MEGEKDMYRIMIVDDEPLILAGITSLVNWSEYDCSIVGKATNGQQALMKMKELVPDIVITDIKMPVMDGIGFMKKCKEEGYNTSFILLTNLEEFSLVKQALSLGALDYLVKIELNEEALVNSLKKALEICAERSKINDNRISNHYIKISTEEMTKKYFQQVLLYEKSSEDLTAETRQLEINEKFCNPIMLIISINHGRVGFIDSENIDNIDNIDRIMAYAENILVEMVKRFFINSCILKWEQNSFMIIVSSKQTENMKNVIQNMSEKIISILKDYFEVSVVIGVSEMAEDVFKFPKMIYQVISALDYYYYDSSNQIIFYIQKCNMNQEQNNNFNINSLRIHLLNAIKQNDNEKFYEICEQITGVFEKYKPSKGRAVNECIKIYYGIYSLYENLDDIDQNLFPYTENMIGQLNHFASLKDIIEWLNIFFNRVYNVLEMKRNTKTEKIIEIAKSYVEKHYKEKLSLSTVAEKIGISEGYLSNIFKKHTGNNFSNYVSEIKIEKAKELIANHKYMMYEISDILGFENQYYFSKVFKKMTGITPKEYEVSLLDKTL